MLWMKQIWFLFFDQTRYVGIAGKNRNEFHAIQSCLLISGMRPVWPLRFMFTLFISNVWRLSKSNVWSAALRPSTTATVSRHFQSTDSGHQHQVLDSRPRSGVRVCISKSAGFICCSSVVTTGRPNETKKALFARRASRASCIREKRSANVYGRNVWQREP